MTDPAMYPTAPPLNSAVSRLRRYVLLCVMVWTSMVVLSLCWNVFLVKQSAARLGETEAESLFEKDVLYRRWNALQGGVYAPVSAHMSPNVYLDVPERDIQTPSGRELTLVNPAYMTRQVHDLGEVSLQVKGHITSLKPIRPDNAPDAWETEALKAFERGSSVASAVAQIDGEPYYRLMRPLLTEQACLTCHAKQGYKPGEIRGGISVAVPMAPLDAVQQMQVQSMAVGHAVFWAAGMLGIGMVSRHARQREEEKRQAEAQLQHHQRMAALGTFAGGVAHEINNPLAGIMGFAELIRDEMPSSSPVREYAEMLIRQTNRAAGVTSSLLAFAGGEQQSLEGVDTRRLIEDVLSLVQASIGAEVIRLDTDLPEGLPDVVCRSRQIQQVLMNLLANAREALGEVQPDPDRVKTIKVSARQILRHGVRWVRITVEDSGPGIPAEAVDRVFEPFFTTKERATHAGLGLAVSYGIVEQHHGTLHFEATPDRHTRFHIDLPAAAPA